MPKRSQTYYTKHKHTAGVADDTECLCSAAPSELVVFVDTPTLLVVV